MNKALRMFTKYLPKCIWYIIVLIAVNSPSALGQNTNPQVFRSGVIVDASYLGNINSGAFQLQSRILTKGRVQGLAWGIGFTAYGASVEHAVKHSTPGSFLAPYLFAGYIFPSRGKVFNGFDLSLGATNATYWEKSSGFITLNIPYQQFEGVSVLTYFAGFHIPPTDKFFFTARGNLSLMVMSGGAFIPLVGFSAGVGVRK